VNLLGEQEKFAEGIYGFGKLSFRINPGLIVQPIALMLCVKGLLMRRRKRIVILTNLSRAMAAKLPPYEVQRKALTAIRPTFFVFS
jgi:hypothetical protein